VGRRAPDEDAHLERLPAADRRGMVDSNPAVDLIVKSHLIPLVLVPGELDAIHAEVRAHDPSRVGVFRVNLGKRDEGASIARPALDARQIRNLDPVAKNGSGADSLRDGTRRGQRGRESSERLPPGVPGIGFDLDDALDGFESVAKQEPRPIEGPEEVRHRLESRALDSLEQKRGRARDIGTALDLRHLQMRVDFLANPRQMTVALEIGEAAAETLVAHGKHLTMAAVVRMWIAFVCAAALAARAGDCGEKDFLSRVRRLTFDGRRAGEGYFSPDGKRMVFQSEREEGNPFYQIYELDRTTGESHRVSPGIGKTTCSFFQPGTGSVLFASTHHDPRSGELQKAELELRAAGKERRYSWDYDPEMELYVLDRVSGDLRRLTDVRGYDAEGSYSPDGEWIVFSSMREAYSRELLPDEKKTLEINPAFFAEIYIMRADGSEVRRLTDAAGYDGGPFFFADGSRILWRRFDAEGLIADVWTMKPDGSDPKRLTDFASMSWAPYAHPSGEYVFFASNKLGFENFEIFIVDAEGTKEPVRITETPGFDGLPVPSPDGTELAWTSTRGGGAGGQIFLASFDHGKALDALAASPPRIPRKLETP
jgi:Tol biopolymer transport system component